MRTTSAFDIRHGGRVTAVLFSPLERIGDVPLWGKIAAIGAAVVQFVATDKFGGAVTLVLVAGIVDYYVGVKGARYQGTFDPKLAHAGAMGKIAGLMLLLLFRLVEYYV